MKTVLHLERKFTSKTETFIVNQINTIKNFNVIVATVNKLDNLPCNKHVIEPKIKNYFNSNGKFLLKRTVNELFEQSKSYNIDLIHAHYLVDAFFFLPLIKKFSVPKLVSCYGYDVSSFPKVYFGLGKLLIRKVFKEYDYFLAMSPDMKNDLLRLGCDENKIIVHYYGTDTKRFINKNRDYPIKNSVNILTVGALEDRKGHFYVVLALDYLFKKFDYSNFKYYVVGDGPNHSSLKKLVVELGLQDHVLFLGHVPYNSDTLIEIYNNSDIFIHPSIVDDKNDKEGIPGTIVEAMANGLPVISTYHAGIPYIIDNEKEGLLLKERDIEGLAEALKRLIENRDLRERLGKEAQKRAIEELDLTKGTERLERIYNQIINSNTL